MGIQLQNALSWTLKGKLAGIMVAVGVARVLSGDIWSVRSVQ